MRSTGGYRIQLGGVLLLAALGTLVLALPGLGMGKQGAPRAAGTIESFDRESGLLVVDLSEGRKAAGLVVRRTHLRCGEGNQRLRGTRSGPARDDDVRGASSPDDDGTPDQGRGDAAGDDRGADDNRGHSNERRRTRCLDQLVPGAVVMRAEIVLAHGNAFFKKLGVLPAVASG